MSSLQEIEKMLPTLTPHEKLRLIEMITTSLRAVYDPPTQPMRQIDYGADLEEDDEGNVNPLTRRYRYLPHRARLFDEGILRVGDRIHVKGHEGEIAIFLNPNEVKYSGQVLKLETWVRLITEQSNVNVYKWCVLERSGETLDELRIKHLGK
jgi:hypothetical protein